MVLFALCAGLTGCQQDASTTTHTDVGAACLSPMSLQSNPVYDCASQELSPDGELRVDVDFNQCLSSSCDRLLRASCEVSRDGAIITVTARADVESESGGSCTDDCGAVTASCSLGKLPEGSYELRYGAATLAFDVPSTTSARCAGKAFGAVCCDDASDCAGGSCEQNRCRP